MQEFSSVTVSAGEAESLTELLNARSAEGWTVVSIVPAAQSIVAYLCRPSGSKAFGATATATTNASLSPEPASTTPATNAAVGPSPTVSPSPSPAASVVDPSPAPAVPSGWYADPSGRFEIRYWDGENWTEHVSRGGQQSTDPPVA